MMFLPVSMKSIIRFLPFILINIVISALTTLAVLWFWEQAHLPYGNVDRDILEAEIVPIDPPPITDEKNIVVTLPPEDVVTIEITNVIGVGDLDSEVVLLTYSGEGQLSLAGWQLYEAGEYHFTFPDVWLAHGGSIKIYSRSGNHTADELYWGLERAVWQNGEVVQLLDYEGNERAVYQIP